MTLATCQSSERIYSIRYSTMSAVEAEAIAEAAARVWAIPEALAFS